MPTIRRASFLFRISIFVMALCLTMGRIVWAEDAKPKTDAPRPRTVLATGFGPFAGRAQNGSWIAAKSLATESETLRVKALEIPVVWGEPRKLIEPVCEKESPEILICFGEGFPFFYTVEAVARNARAPLADVNGAQPPSPKIEENGPAEIAASANTIAVAKTLTEQGYPTHVSTDAGKYLCEETLYTIERLRAKYPSVKTVLFVHLPPFGQPVIAGDKAVKCDETILVGFAKAALTAVLTEADHQNDKKE